MELTLMQIWFWSVCMLEFVCCWSMFGSLYKLSVLLRENFYSSSTPTASEIISKINQASSERNMTLLGSTVQTKQNNCFSWEPKWKTWSMRGETNSPLCVASVHKLSMISMLILDEQQKNCLPKEPDISNYSEGEILSFPVLLYQLFHKSPLHTSCDADSNILHL